MKSYTMKNLLSMNQSDIRNLWWTGKISFEMMSEYDRIKLENYVVNNTKTLFDEMKQCKKQEKVLQGIIYRNMKEAKRSVM